MKKVGLWLLVGVMLFSLAGCGNSAEVNNDYNSLLAEKETLQSQYDDLLSTTRETTMTISGTFTATVRQLIPDYVQSETENGAAVVTGFQSPPFVVRLGDDKIAQLKVGKTYKFEIVEAKVTTTKAQAEAVSTDPAVLIPMYNLRVSSVVETTENGLNANDLTIS